MFSIILLKKRHIILPNRRRLPENRKINSQQEKLVHAVFVASNAQRAHFYDKLSLATNSAGLETNGSQLVTD